MRGPISIPDGHSFDRIFPQCSLGIDLGLIGTRQRNDQIQIYASLQNEPDTTQYAIHFPIAAESIAINGQQATGLLDQVFVCHGSPPVEVEIHNASYVRLCTLYFDYSIQIRLCNALQPLRLCPVTIQSLLNSNLDSKSALASDTRADAATAPDLTDPLVAVAAQFSFDAGQHPRVETVETAATLPGFGGTVSTDNSARPS